MSSALFARYLIRWQWIVVIMLVGVTGAALYGMTRLRPTNGYESRRQQYLAEVSSTRIKAAAAASAIALVQTKLVAGQSTDGVRRLDHVTGLRP